VLDELDLLYLELVCLVFKVFRRTVPLNNSSECLLFIFVGRGINVRYPSHILYIFLPLHVLALAGHLQVEYTIIFFILFYFFFYFFRKLSSDVHFLPLHVLALAGHLQVEYTIIYFILFFIFLRSCLVMYIFCRCMFWPLLAIFRWNTQLFFYFILFFRKLYSDVYFLCCKNP
jgi:hypothetical protein